MVGSNKLKFAFETVLQRKQKLSIVGNYTLYLNRHDQCAVYNLLYWIAVNLIYMISH